MLKIEDRNQFEHAISQPKALIFLWVIWAIHALYSKNVLTALIEILSGNGDEIETQCFMADVSEQQGEVWDSLREWLDTQQQLTDSLTYGGWGDLLWVRSGLVVASTPNLNTRTPADWFALTKTIFQDPAP